MRDLRNGWARLAGILAAAVALPLTLAGCADDGAPDYRYRLTVEVDTPEGLKTGSSVIEVEQRLVRPGSAPASRAIERRARGEAVAVDLPGGQTLFALLRSGDQADWAANVMQYAAPKLSGEAWEEEFDNMLRLDGPVELPLEWTHFSGGMVLDGYPMLVTFTDIDDPTSVTLVDPGDLTASFGEGVTLKRITVQMTDDPVTTGIEERMGWLEAIRGALVDLPIADYPPPSTPLPLHNILTEGDFLRVEKL